MIASLSALQIALPSHAQAPFVSQYGERTIDDYLRQIVRDTYIPGIVALVTNRDEIIYAGAFGSRNVAQGYPMTVDCFPLPGSTPGSCG